MPRSRIGRSELRDRLAVYFVADPEQTDRDFLALVDDALAGGITSLQLRAKRMPGREMYDLAVVLRERCRSAGALFFVNDRVDIAVAADADGVHVGMHDLPLEAIETAKIWLTGAIRESYAIGDGNSPVNHFHAVDLAPLAGGRT